MTLGVDEPRTGSRAAITRLIVADVAVVVLFVIVVLSTVIAGIPLFTPPTSQSRPLPEKDPLPTHAQLPPPDAETREGNDVLLTILGMLVALVVIAVAVVVIVVLARTVIRFWRERPLRRTSGDDMAFEVEAGVGQHEPDTPAIRRGIDSAQHTIRTTATAADGIVAAWIVLEETAAAAGLRRAASETPAEFTARILSRRPGIDDAVHRLLRIYEQVRFGAHAPDERTRADVEHALVEIADGWR